MYFLFSMTGDSFYLFSCNAFTSVSSSLVCVQSKHKSTSEVIFLHDRDEPKLPERQIRSQREEKNLTSSKWDGKYTQHRKSHSWLFSFQSGQMRPKADLSWLWKWIGLVSRVENSPTVLTLFLDHIISMSLDCVMKVITEKSINQINWYNAVPCHDWDNIADNQ